MSFEDRNVRRRGERPQPLFLQPLFALLLLASLVSNIGTWMHDAAASWLMALLTKSPVMMALIQSATSVPLFLLSLPAGAVADKLDRRRLLIGTQCWMMIVALSLGILTIAGIRTPWVLLSFTFLLSAGAAMTGPAWHSIFPDLVEPHELPSAISLRDVCFNISRIAGPVIGGLIIAMFGGAEIGAGSVFILNALSFSGVIAVLLKWQSRPRLKIAQSESVIRSIRTGARYVWSAVEIRELLIRASLFVSFESALLALLPLFARVELNLSARGYGALMGSFGAGAIAAGFSFPILRRSLSINTLASLAMIFAGVMLVWLSRAHGFYIACFSVFVSGGMWLTIIMSFNITLLGKAPEWVRARCMAIFQFLFFGCFAGGSFLWGATAALYGIRSTLTMAGVGLLFERIIASRQGIRDTCRYILVRGKL
jgi:MFS family permease